jgi:hypothetical protein
MADALLNVAMFVPVGAIVFRRWGSIVGAGLVGAALSTAIELIQVLVPGRYTTLGDVVWNAIGAVVGAAIWIFWRDARAGGRAARRWWLPINGIVGCCIVASGWLLGPSPTRDLYYGQWTPSLRNMEPNRGRLLQVALAGASVPNGPYQGPPDLSDALSGDWAFEALLEVGPPVEGLSPIFAIHDEHEREVFLVAALGTDLVLRERTRAATFKLDQPSFAFAGPLGPLEPGDTVRIQASRAGAVSCLRIERQDACGHAVTFGRGWSLLLYPEGAPSSTLGFLDAGWLLALFFPVGLAAIDARRFTIGAGWLAACALLAILTTRLVAPTTTEVLAMLAGAWLGGGARVIGRK